jgi:ABC-type arginine/histidine transport system permease subunit
MIFARRVSLLAGAWGLLLMVPMSFLRVAHQRRAAAREYCYGFVGVPLVFQILFFVIARNQTPPDTAS